MKLKQLLETCVEVGIDHDIRGRKALEKSLKQMNEQYESLEGIEKELFDKERLWNPYHDSRILNGDEDEEIKTIFVGIDIDVAQILVADRLRERGEKIDCLMLHHPQGRASVELAKDMLLQVDLYRKYGVPEVQIEQQLESKIESTLRTSHGDNVFEWQRTVELIGFPALGVHTPADNMVYQYVEKFISEKSYENIGELEKALLEIPEFKEYAKSGIRPLLINCSRDSRTGVIAPTGITGGTDGPEIFVAEQAEAGIGTIISMHASDAYKDMAQKHHVNIIQLSHYAADILGMNLLLDYLEKEDPKLKFIPGCGFMRFKRGADVHKALRTNAKESEKRSLAHSRR
jgi:hypothetical protein